jgi:hypothetical protein
MQTSGVLNKIITDAWIQTEAGDLYCDRGLDYFEEGRVSGKYKAKRNLMKLTEQRHKFLYLR